MADVHDKKTRSYNMSRIKGKNTLPEIKVRKYLFAEGFRYRIHNSKFPGKPDILLKKYKTAIFIHGCFWHGHKNCKYFKIPKTRTKWWRNKITGNIINDAKKIRKLKKLGWKIIVVYECKLRKEKYDATLLTIKRKLLK